MSALGGAVLILPAALTACDGEVLDPADKAVFDFSTEVGAINLAYAMEQVQFQFYQRISSYLTFVGITRYEVNGMFNFNTGNQAIQARHADLIRRSQPSERIPDFLNVPFPGVDFSSRSAVYAVGIALEELSTGMYPGLIPYATSDKWRMLFAKMGSVEARHAATIRDLADIYAGNSDTAARTAFAGDDVIPAATGLGKILSPAEVVDGLRPYVTTELSLRGV